MRPRESLTTLGPIGVPMGTVGREEVDPDAHSAAPREQVLRRMEGLHQASLYPVGREKLSYGLDLPQDQIDAAVASLLSEALMEEPEAGWYKLTEAGRAAARAAEAADQWAQTLPPDDVSLYSTSGGLYRATPSAEDPEAPRLIISRRDSRIELTPSESASVVGHLDTAATALGELRKTLEGRDAVEAEAELQEYLEPTAGVGHNRPPNVVEEIHELAEEGSEALKREEVRLGTLRAVQVALRYYWERFAEAASSSAGKAFGTSLGALLVGLLADAVGALDALMEALGPLFK